MSEAVNDDVVFENERYIVSIADADQVGCAVEAGGFEYETFYIAVNRQTGVIELATPQLPSAIETVSYMNRVLRAQPWEWLEDPDDEDGEDNVVPHTVH